MTPVTVTECARCERDRPIRPGRRGLCESCHHLVRRGGTLSDYGYCRAERLAEYAGLRTRGLDVASAAERIGVSYRTAQRYEAAHVKAGTALWRPVTENHVSEAA